MDLAPHTGFILGSYAFTALVLGGLILNAIRDQRAQKRALTDASGGRARRRPPVTAPVPPSDPEDKPPEPVRRSLLLIVPLIAFAVLAGLFFLRLRSGVDPAALPSAMIGKPVPAFDLAGVPGLEAEGRPLPGLSSRDFRAASRW